MSLRDNAEALGIAIVEMNEAARNGGQRRHAEGTPTAERLTHLCREVGLFDSATKFDDPIPELGCAYASFWLMREAGAAGFMSDDRIHDIEVRLSNAWKAVKEEADQCKS